ncbi:MAG: diacylglycerol kinase family protein [Gammaproteobacteria bacterium]
MRIKVIINASAGTDDQAQEHRRLTEIFEASDHEVSISLAHSGDELAGLVHRSTSENFHTIVAGGGDGTINTVASALIGKNISLGILPLGTFNYFARNLNIPLDLEQAALNIIAGHTVPVNVGEVNGRLFINNSSLGLYPTIIREREKAYDRWGRSKFAALLSGAITMLRPNPFLKVHLNADRKEIACRTPLIFVNNNACQMESYNIGGGECLAEGKLGLYVTRPSNWPGLLWLAVRALCGRLRETSDLRVMCTQEAWIETRHRHIRVAIDGEVVRLSTPLHYRMLHGALRVIVPAGTSGSATKKNE